jgi:hypothetical protein
MAAITGFRSVVGKMSAGVFALGIAAFLLGFFHPWFFPVAWGSLLGGGGVAALIWNKHRRSSHPTISHLAEDPEEAAPIQRVASRGVRHR